MNKSSLVILSRGKLAAFQIQRIASAGLGRGNWGSIMNSEFQLLTLAGLLEDPFPRRSGMLISKENGGNL